MLSAFSGCGVRSCSVFGCDSLLAVMVLAVIVSVLVCGARILSPASETIFFSPKKTFI